jgi:hypothetical protein
MMKFVYHGKVYVRSSERDEERAAYTALQNWRSKIVSGTTSPGEHRVKVSERRRFRSLRGAEME